MWQVTGSAVHLPHGRASLQLHGACNFVWNCMQIERSVYEAASRAVLHQREPDGTKKAHPTHPSQAAASTSAGTALVYSQVTVTKPPWCALCAVQRTEGKGAGYIGTASISYKTCCKYAVVKAWWKASFVYLSTAHAWRLLHGVITAMVAVVGCHAHLVPLLCCCPLPSPPPPLVSAVILLQLSCATCLWLCRS